MAGVPLVALDMVPSHGKHAGKDIAVIFFNTVKNYNIQEKVQGITLDNASANTSFIRQLGTLMRSENIEFDVEDQHFRCFSHIINLAVQDILKLIKFDVENSSFKDLYTDENEVSDNESFSDDSSDYDHADDNVLSNSVAKIRVICKKVRYSEQLKNKLKLFCEAAGIKFINLILDVRTRWDSSYDMIDTAFRMKKALIMLLDNCNELAKLKMSEYEWAYLQQIMKFLKNFKFVSKLLAYEKNVTLPSVVVAFNVLIDKLESVIFELDSKSHRSIVDETLLLAFQAGRDKLLKHYKKCNWIYCISLILDPRHKIECFD